MDSSGTATLAGKADSVNFPAQQPLQGRAGLTDAFVTTFQWNAATAQLSYGYSTVLGGTNDDAANGIALDSNGNAVLIGSTDSPDCPLSYRDPIGGPGDQVPLAFVAKLTAASTSGARTLAYTYDALSRTKTVAGAQSRTYTYNGDGVLVRQVAGATTTDYTQDLASPLAQVLQTKVGATTTSSLYGLERLASRSGTPRTWYLADALGSVRRTLSDSGAATGPVFYDPWGTPESGTVPTFGFTGELQDTAAGLVNLRARWYSTGQGRFTSRDPFAGDPAQPYSQHPYQYGLSDPVLNTDPTGRYSHSNAERMIQVYYELSPLSNRLSGGTVYPNLGSWAEYTISLASKSDLLVSPGPSPILTGDRPDSPEAGYMDIVDIAGNLTYGYAYEIKPEAPSASADIQFNKGTPWSNKGTVVAYVDIQHYVTIYNALPQGTRNTQGRSEPRVLRYGTDFPEAWQIVGTDPKNNNSAILVRRAGLGVLIWKSEPKQWLTVPVPDYVYEYQNGQVVKRRPDASWPRIAPGLVPQLAILGTQVALTACALWLERDQIARDTLGQIVTGVAKVGEQLDPNSMQPGMFGAAGAMYYAFP